MGSGAQRRREAEVRELDSEYGARTVLSFLKRMDIDSGWPTQTLFWLEWATRPCSIGRENLRTGDKHMTIPRPDSAYDHKPSRSEKVPYPVAPSGGSTSFCS